MNATKSASYAIIYLPAVFCFSGLSFIFMYALQSVPSEMDKMCFFVYASHWISNKDWYIMDIHKFMYQ